MSVRVPPAQSLRLNPRLLHQTQAVGFKIHAQVAALRRRGVEVIDLSIGEPDLDTPVHIREAAKRAIDQGATRYTESAGTKELRAVAADWLSKAHGIAIAPERVLVSSGSKQALYSLFQVFLTEGDEVIIPSPLWSSYREIVALAGGKAVLVPCEPSEGFVPDPEKIGRAFGERTRVLLVSSPNNPTGAAYPVSLMRELIERCAKSGVLFVADTIYRSLYDGPEMVPIAQLAEEAGAPWFIVDGVSKSYCMTGWRIGLSVGPEPLIRAMTIVQSHSTSCPCSVSQAATVAALTGPQDFLVMLRNEFGRRRASFLERLHGMKGATLPVDPQGAFYVLPSFAAFADARCPDGRILTDDQALAEYLLAEAGVAVIGGSAFDAPWFIRFAYVVSTPKLELATSRIAAALARLTPAGKLG